MDQRFDSFLKAQEPVYDRVCAELTRGRKTSHWMWYVFPQIAGLGRSAMAQKFALSSLEDARAYLAHPTLGARLVECTELVNQVEGRTAREIFGDIDRTKFRSSMTLFAHAAAENPVFEEALQKYFNGQHDPLTLVRI